MVNNTIVIRVQSSIGISRICLCHNSTLGDLKAELLKRIVIDGNNDVKLVIDGVNKEVIGPDNQLLSDLGITHGTCLRLEQYNSGTSLRYAACSDADKDDAPSTPRRYETTEDKSNGPKFKSFDSYLKSCGYNIGDLAMKQSFKPVILEKGKMNKLPLGITIKHQPYRHVDHLEMMNTHDIQNFANYWMDDLEMAQQRAGWLYGYYVEDSHYPLGVRAVCEAIYEPPQVSGLDEVKMQPDPFLDFVDAISERLGLERIGHIFTHLPRSLYLSPQEVVDCAQIQLDRIVDTHYTGYPTTTHVTCTLHPGDDGKPVLNAFMVSDTAMVMLRDGLIQRIQPDTQNLLLSKARHMREILPQVFVSGKQVEEVDPSWFVVRVNDSAPIKQNSIFKYFDFPRENRFGQQIGVTHVQRYFSTKLTSNHEPAHASTYSDFHLLLYIAKVLDLETALVIADAIYKGETVDTVIQELLNI